MKGLKCVIPESKKAYNWQFIVKTNDDDLDVAVGRKRIFDNFHEKVVKSVMVHGIRDQFFPVQGKKPVLLDNHQITRLQWVLTSKYPHFEGICYDQLENFEPELVRSEFPPEFVVNVVMGANQNVNRFFYVPP